MDDRRGSEILEGWPDESKEAAKLVLEKYGEPQEATESQLVWHRVGPWKRVVASKAFWKHDFPAPHYDRPPRSSLCSSERPSAGGAYLRCDPDMSRAGHPWPVLTARA